MSDIILVVGDNRLDVNLIPLTANLVGIVTDASTGLPIQGVKVTINGLTAYTDASGAYAFAGLTPGAYTITFSKGGYETLVR